MSRKRSLKKQQKRQEAALVQLEALYRRGADDEFLARTAQEVKDPAGSALGPEWRQAADRAVRQSLAQGDLARLDRLLVSLRRGGRLPPLAALGEAVLDLATGRLEAAGTRLSALAGAAGDHGAIPADLLAGLQALARPGLTGCGAAGAPSGDSYLRAAQDSLRTLQNVAARTVAPTAAERKALSRSLEALGSAAPAEDADLRRLLDGAGRCLSLLADLAGLEAKLARLPQGVGSRRRASGGERSRARKDPAAPATPQEGGRSRASHAVASWLRGPGPLLAATLAEAGAPLLAPLRHAVRTAWRAVLERVLAREGTTGLAALCAADPKLLAADVDLPGGVQGGLTGLKQRAEARRLLGDRDYGDLANLLRTRSRTEPDAGNLAALWTLELWAWSRQDRSGGDEEDLLDDLVQGLGDSRSEPPAHRALVRLQEMAAEVARRFPAELRPEVARVLREELFELCESLSLCDHTAGAALSLLEHLPGDVGLLIAGVAGAIAGGEPRIERARETRLARRGTVQASERAVAERLMAQAAQEEPRDLARILDALRPLFADDAWPEIAALVARELAVPFARLLTEASLEEMADPGLGSLAVADARRELDRLRPVLGAAPGFAAVELALDCWGPDRAAVDRRLKKFLAASPGFEGALAALRVLQRALAPWVPRGADRAMAVLAQAVIDRLDDRWQLWAHDVPFLVMTADRLHVRRLEERVRRLLTSPDIQGQGREVLHQAFHAIQDVEEMKRETRRPGRRRASRGRSRPLLPGPQRRRGEPRGSAPNDPEAAPRQPRRKQPPRRRAEGPQLHLEFD